MEEQKKKIKVKDNSNSNSNTNTKVTISYVILTILAGILTLLPVSYWLLDFIESNSQTMHIEWEIFIFSNYILNIIGLLIYIFAIKEITLRKKSVLTACVCASLVSLVFSIYDELTTSSDLSEGFTIATIIALSYIVYYISAFILFVLYVKKFIKLKQILIIVAIILLFAIGYKVISNVKEKRKVENGLQTVSEFENELKERNLYTNKYMLYGINNEEGYIHKLNFSGYRDLEYPAFVYIGYKTEGNLEDDYTWIIYYINGKMYAILGKIYKTSEPNLEKEYNNFKLLSEENQVYTYNYEKNIYEKVINQNKLLYIDCLRTKKENGVISYIDFISKGDTDNTEAIIFDGYEVINKIDSVNLDNYAKSVASNNYANNTVNEY